VLSILDAALDRNLFGRWFRAPSWQAWLVVAKVLFALPLTEEDLAIYRRHTGRSQPPASPIREAWFLIGRRGGKTLFLAFVAVFVACFRDHSGALAPGERGVVMLLGADREQAKVCFRYVRAFLMGVPMLRRLVQRETAEEIDLSNGITLAIHTSNYRLVRGRTIVAAICDEIAFWRSDESANPDSEVIAAIRPAMATIPDALLVAISSPYSRRGALWAAYRRYYGDDDADVLVWQAPTRAMNPTIPAEVVERALAEDEGSASAEYLATFRHDIESFVSREAVDAVVIPERRSLPPVEGVSYEAFCDPSGGSSDSMTLAIAHREDGRAVLDLVREVRPPFSPEVVVEDFAETLARYHIGQIRGDRYAAEWCSERFRKAGVTYLPAEKPKSDLYREFLPCVNAQTVELLDHPKLIAQLCSLERRTARGGRDSIDHPPKSHDDVCNAVAGAVHLVLGRSRGITPSDALEYMAHTSAMADDSF
jgi:hypothetical protein